MKTKKKKTYNVLYTNTKHKRQRQETYLRENIKNKLHPLKQLKICMVLKGFLKIKQWFYRR